MGSAHQTTGSLSPQIPGWASMKSYRVYNMVASPQGDVPFIYPCRNHNHDSKWFIHPLLEARSSPHAVLRLWAHDETWWHMKLNDHPIIQTSGWTRHALAPRYRFSSGTQRRTYAPEGSCEAPLGEIVKFLRARLGDNKIQAVLKDGAPKIAKLPCKWLKYGLC